jgi:intergrase/recombinase
MGKKTETTIKIDRELLKQAKQVGLDLSQFTEYSLRSAINAIARAGSPVWIGHEPPKQLANETAFTLPGECSAVNLQDVDWPGFKEWCYSRYAKGWSAAVFRYAREYHELLSGDLSKLETLSKAKRKNVLSSLTALAKYLGIYESFKTKMKNYGVKWATRKSVDSVVRILEAKDDVLDWAKTATERLENSYATLVKLAAASGLRKTESIDAFNLAVKLQNAGKLGDYYHPELQALEHFKHPETFIRDTKNVFFSFVPKHLITEVTAGHPISHTTLRRKLKKHDLPLRFAELRDYFATFMVHNGVIQQEVDLLQGRIGRSIFMRHYFSPDIENLRDRVLAAIAKLPVLH